MEAEVTRSHAVTRDLEEIFEFLFHSALDFGDDQESAMESATRRVRAISSSIEQLGRVAHQGTMRPELGCDVRNVTKGRAAIYFHVEERNRKITVLGVFFGGQDHAVHILRRLVGE